MTVECVTTIKVILNDWLFYHCESNTSCLTRLDYCSKVKRYFRLKYYKVVILDSWIVDYCKILILYDWLEYCIIVILYGWLKYCKIVRDGIIVKDFRFSWQKIEIQQNRCSIFHALKLMQII